jgi:hypothetical protein
MNRFQALPKCELRSRVAEHRRIRGILHFRGHDLSQFLVDSVRPTIVGGLVL